MFVCVKNMRNICIALLLTTFRSYTKHNEFKIVFIKNLLKWHLKTM